MSDTRDTPEQGNEQVNEADENTIKSGEELTIPMPIRKDRDGNEVELDMTVTRNELESYMNDIPRRYVRPEEPMAMVDRARLAVAASKMPLKPDDQAVTGPDRQFEARRLPEYKDVDKELEDEMYERAGVERDQADGEPEQQTQPPAGDQQPSPA